MSETQATTLLLFIIFLSTLSNYRQKELPDNYIQIIDNDEFLNYSNNYNSIDPPDKVNTADTVHTFINNRTDNKKGKEWMKKYRYGIIFEFNP